MSSIRIGVVGLGQMGRHHARILQRMAGVEFAGAVDPTGDPYEALWIDRPLGTLLDLLERGIDAAVVAVPTAEHEAVARQLAEAGVHMLLEKPVADDVEAAERIREAYATRQLVAAVGHVERFNPALQEMKHRLDRRDLGEVFSISTQRVGPFPNRITDVGVVKDLATHDIDLVRWLGSSEFERVCGFTAHRMGRQHEDLVSVSGVLQSGVVVNMQVNWLTPTKRRSVVAIGERGAFAADMLAADLTFYTNASVPTEWDAMARLRGVSEGDMIRYAIRKPEPLQSELEAFRDAVLGDESAPIVSLADGVATLRVAEAILRSATSAEVVSR